MSTALHQFWWVKFDNDAVPPSCVELPSTNVDEVMEFATMMTGVDAVSVETLPHAAQPRLNSRMTPLGNRSWVSSPTICITPERCAGREKCPRIPSCNNG